MSTTGRVPEGVDHLPGAAAVATTGESATGERPYARLVVFDFDHTLYDGDSGSHLVLWLIKRDWARVVAAIALSPLLLPLIAWLPTRRHAISVYLWIATFGTHRRHDMDRLIDLYVRKHAKEIRGRLLPIALKVLQKHRDAGDRVIIATGAAPELARAILDFVAHEDLPVIGSIGGPFLGGMITVEHCHHENKMRMIWDAGYEQIAVAYSDSSADLPLLKAARKPVVVNPKRRRVAMFRRVLPPGTPILNWGCKERGGDPVQG